MGLKGHKEEIMDQLKDMGHVDMLLQIFSADDGGFLVTGGGIRFTPQNLHQLVEAVQNVILSAFGEKRKIETKQQVDN